jgi:hypothetical protein
MVTTGITRMEILDDEEINYSRERVIYKMSEDWI